MNIKKQNRVRGEKLGIKKEGDERRKIGRNSRSSFGCAFKMTERAFGENIFRTNL